MNYSYNKNNIRATVNVTTPVITVPIKVITEHWILCMLSSLRKP